jgi:hypothetical protein
VGQASGSQLGAQGSLSIRLARPFDTPAYEGRRLCCVVCPSLGKPHGRRREINFVGPTGPPIDGRANRSDLWICSSAGGMCESSPRDATGSPEGHRGHTGGARDHLGAAGDAAE